MTRAELLERMESEMYEPMPPTVTHDDVDLADDLSKLVALVRQALGD